MVYPRDCHGSPATASAPHAASSRLLKLHNGSSIGSGMAASSLLDCAVAGVHSSPLPRAGAGWRVTPPAATSHATRIHRASHPYADRGGDGDVGWRKRMTGLN
ncbi:hypothetical protein TSOC_001292 [Tetrabaena socialis]|uniref:Uncharacterized protein n=1 Tax=Tetrabaena socialis TaxID=47790 RepID=A0A2J8AH12_9CHLO|nr:hypothetical protein TSOC_001292 [Tetrabaena socialis]|eukprot:PNH11805.1 hypothetical protein TSOC_001292 [Tetrabaena socialis]